MARPRKLENEKLVPAKTTLRPDQFDVLDAEARRRDVPLSRIIRERVEQSFGNPKHKPALI